MKNKVAMVMVVLVLLCVVSQLQAATPRYWFNTGGNDLWSNGANWASSYDVPPQPGDSAYILDGQAPVGDTNPCLLTAGVDASGLVEVKVGAYAYNGLAEMEISGGSLGTTDFYIGEGVQGSVLMGGGTLTCTRYFVVGNDYGTLGNGVLTLTNGVINAQHLLVANGANSIGRVHLDGGTLNIGSSLGISNVNPFWGWANDTSDGLVDIAGGQIVFNFNQDLTWLATYFNSQGLMTAYDGQGTFVSTQDPLTGWTTISAEIPEPATVVLLTCGLAGLLRRRKIA